MGRNLSTSKEQDVKMLQLKDSGLSVAEVAKQIGVSESTARRAIKRVQSESITVSDSADVTVVADSISIQADEATYTVAGIDTAKEGSDVGYSTYEQSYVSSPVEQSPVMNVVNSYLKTEAPAQLGTQSSSFIDKVKSFFKSLIG